MFIPTNIIIINFVGGQGEKMKNKRLQLPWTMIIGCYQKL